MGEHIFGYTKVKNRLFERKFIFIWWDVHKLPKKSRCISKRLINPIYILCLFHRTLTFCSLGNEKIVLLEIFANKMQVGWKYAVKVFLPFSFRRGKVVLGYTEIELCMRGSGYQFIHAADMMYCADNHIRSELCQTLTKHLHSNQSLTGSPWPVHNYELASYNWRYTDV